MIDILKCSHCGISVEWANYGNHIELYHGNWGGIRRPATIEAETLAAVEDRVLELETDVDDLSEAKEGDKADFEDKIETLELDIASLTEKNHELQDKIDHLEATP